MSYNVQACEAARINYQRIMKTAKKNCRCNTKECPNWECQCEEEEDSGEMGPCSCRPCSCDQCYSCKVSSILAK